MAYTDINPDVVAEIASDVADTLNNINEDFDRFQSEVFDKIKESWYNENAIKVMPDSVTSMTKVNKGVNDSLTSLGKALGGAAEAWARANGAAGYSIKLIANNAKALVCDVADNKNGFKGMDVEDIQQAINHAETIKSDMIERLTKLEAAGNREGFRGGNMQAQLSNVCETLRTQIKNACDQIINEITSNTGTAKSNVEEAKTTTESTFTIS